MTSGTRAAGGPPAPSRRRPRVTAISGMKWWERWAFHVFHLLVSVSGTAYFVMKWLLETDDPFALVNHAWQPAMLAAHVVAAPFLVASFGMVFRSHAARKVAVSEPKHRRSGWVSLLGFAVMAVSGYLIQVGTAPWFLSAAIWVHVASSAVFVAGYAVHLVLGWRARPAVGRAAAAVVLCAAAGSAAAGETPPVRVERTVFLMGTAARFVTEAPDRPSGLRRLERMIRVVEETEAELSTWREDSALSELNRQPVGEPRRAAARVCAVLERAAKWREATGGAFDPALGRLVEAWGLRGGGREPSAGELADARAAAGLHHLVVEPGACRITRRAPVTLDAGAFGKGEALDRVREAEGGRSGAWMVDLGGQVAVADAPAGEPWTIALAHPERRGLAVARLELRGGSLATSGGSERDPGVAGGRRLGHILDPRSGHPVRRRSSAVVWHRRAFAADALSTALQVMGPEEGLTWAETREVAALFLVPGAGANEVDFRSSRAFRERFRLLLPAGGRRAGEPDSR